MSPSSNAGDYTISSPDGHYAIVNSDTIEPLDQSNFTFRLSNEVLRKLSASISPINIFSLNDPRLAKLQIRTLADIAIDPTTGGSAWTITIPSKGTYSISQVLPNGAVIIQDNGTLVAGIINYNLKNSAGVTVLTSSCELNIKTSAVVDFSGGTMLLRGSSVPVSSFTTLFPYVQMGYYVQIGAAQYMITSLVDGHPYQAVIEGYTGSAASGITVVVYQRLADNIVGGFGYRGMMLSTLTNQETALSIANGDNPSTTQLENNLWKENFLVLIDNNYYAIDQIDGNDITLNGPKKEWTTAGGSVTYSILKISANQFPMDQTSGFMDRRANNLYEIKTSSPETIIMTASAMNAANSGVQVDTTKQTESITFKVEMIG